jgi:hypothetical protein
MPKLRRIEQGPVSVAPKRAGPESFGGGKGEALIGAALKEVGRAGMQIYDAKMRQRAIAAHSAYRKEQSDWIAAHRDDPDYDTFEERFNKASEEMAARHRKTIFGGPYQLAFDERVAGTVEQGVARVRGYVYKRSIADARRDTKQSHFDDINEAAREETATGRAVIREQHIADIDKAVKGGWLDAEEGLALERSFDSEVPTARAIREIGEDAEGALEALKAREDDYANLDQTQLLRLMKLAEREASRQRTERNRERSQQEADRLMSIPGLGLEERLEEARKLPSEIRDDVVARIKVRHGEALTLQNQRELLLIEDAWEAFESRAAYSIDDIPPEMPIAEQRTLKKAIVDRAKGKKEVNEAKVFGELVEMRLMHPDVFRDLNLWAYRSKLSSERFSELRLEQKRMREGLAEPSGLMSTMARQKKRLEENGFSDKQIDKFTLALDDLHRAEAADKKKEKLSVSEMDEAVDRALEEVVRDEDLLWDDRTTRLEIMAGTKVIGDVPEEYREDIRLEIESRGVEASEELIRDVYRRWIIRGSPE